MNLRSGKHLVCHSDIIYSYELEDKYLPSIYYLLKKMVSSVIDLDVSDMSKAQIFNEKIRMLREIYYLIQYYGLKTNPRFENEIIILKKKALIFRMSIIDNINRSINNNDFILTLQDITAAECLSTELMDLLL